MKLSTLVADRYRSIRSQEVALNDFNLFIGANASGKSTILNTLRFLSEAVRIRDFGGPVFARGGLIELAWKGEAAQRIGLTVRLDDDGRQFEWALRLVKTPGFVENADGFAAEEYVDELRPGRPPVRLLEAAHGEGWWSGEQGRVELKQSPTACALAAASADASFPARDVAAFIGRWGFFDPSPFFLRRDWGELGLNRLDPFGRNLGRTLHALSLSSPETLRRIVESTRAIVGLPSGLEPRESDERFYFVQTEPGLEYPVPQAAVSSGTLRMLALMTALYADSETNLIGIEEPENYVHPTALSALVEHLMRVQDRIQFMVTTHSPLLLDYLGAPEAVRVVRRDGQGGTIVAQPDDPAGVRRALDESGFGLGEFYESKGFGGG